MFLPEYASNEAIQLGFQWDIPDDFNIAAAVCDDWARREPARICLQHFSPDGHHLQMSYGELAARSSAFAHGLERLGITRGDRVGLLLPQGFDTVIAHVAIYRLGAIAVPLALLFGPEALEYRLAAAGVSAIVTNDFGLSRLSGVAQSLPDLKHVISVDGAAEGVLALEALVDGMPEEYTGPLLGPDDPALMIFTSGTTGRPKGALHGHRVLAGHIPGFQYAHDFIPRPDDRMWTPSDWAWAGGLLNALFPALMLGVPVVSSPAQKFEPEMAFRIMAEMKVRNAFIPPTALRLMRSVSRPRERYDLVLRTIGSAGESLGRETHEWVRKSLGVVPNEFYGQTECNFVLASAARLGVSKPGKIGLPVPGHRVAVVDEKGRECRSGDVGQIAIARPDPVMFLGYWNDPAATEAKFIGDWMLTGDLGRTDKDGYVEFIGRDDDVITSSGYRIGPVEIEDCLLSHPAVKLAAAIGKPDPLRTEIVKVFIVLQDGVAADAAREEELRAYVKDRLSMHEYPREIEFVDALPMTTSGKIIRRELRDREAATVAPVQSQATI